MAESASNPSPTGDEDMMHPVLPTVESEDDGRRSRPSSATQGDTSTLLRNIGEGLARVDTESEDEMGSEDGEHDIGSGDEREDIETDLVVLDPDHPLMKRFQAALKTQLAKQLEKAKLEKKELMDEVKRKKTKREEVGVTLYGVQQELARQQVNLESLRDKKTSANERRRDHEQQLSKLRDVYKGVQSQAGSHRKKNSELQTEVENLATRLFYMKRAKEDVQSDISVMKRAAEKAEVEISQSEVDKKRQDLYIDRLTERVEQLREMIAMYEAQQSAQSQETKAAKEALSEARTEIEAIDMEKKQLYQQWTSSLIGMKRRDEAHAAMQEALSLAKQQVKSHLTEIDGYKKSIQKEEEKNETLTMVLNKAENDISVTKKLISQSLAKQENTKQQYSTYSRTLHETEQAVNRANTERSMRLSEINVLRKQIEREYREKVKLEDLIMTKLQQQLTADKASVYTTKVTTEIRDRKKALDADYAKVENEIAQCNRQKADYEARTTELQKQLDELEKHIVSSNELINRAEHDASKRNAVIERKQTIIDQYNKKLEQIVMSSGGEEIGPLQTQINSLNKQIESMGGEITDLQQFWLRQQHELVSLSKERDQQQTDVETLKKQHTILLQKKLRIEGEIDQQVAEQNEIDRSIRNMQNRMTKLNTLLTRERGIEENLEQGNKLTENEFVQGLKEAELESIQMQKELDGLKEEKERLLNSLVEAERQIMLWEKKTQLAKETRAAVDSEVGQSEIKAMKAEIHRMQVRYTQLMKQQEQMIREMEQVVSRRDTIVTRGEAQSKIDKKTPTKGAFQKKLVEIKKKIKNTQRDANACDEDIRQLRENQAEVSRSLEEKQITVQQLQGNVDTLEGDVEHLAELKQKNLFNIVEKQSKLKYLQSVKGGKYSSLCKTDEALEAEMQKQDDRLHHTMNILDRLSQEYPQAQQTMRRIMVCFGPREDET
ncbi:coiled-coil domain-containing protein 40-like isoform X1 [Styela clava]|uniref:coiled-coil domain-containing protein 40-like n=1 Tax=Styela clava TaxID=7725 RepID=UPI0019394FA8|nr:coiled-coil domain-containing protein 40-like [Styela clava]